MIDILNKHYKKTIALNACIIIGISLYLILNHSFTFEHSSHYANIFVSGSLFGEIYHEFNLKDMIFISDLYRILYTHFPSVPWFPISLICCLSMSILLLMYVLIRKIYIPQQKPLIIQFIATLSIIFIVLPHFTYLEHNRCSFILGVSGIWILYQFPIQSISYFLGLLLFTLSVLFRIEAATGVIVLIYPLIILWNGKNIKRYIPNLSLPLLILFIAHAIFIYKTSFSTEHYYQIEPDFEYEIMNKRNIVDLSKMDNKNDSIKYEMVNNWLLVDVDSLNAEFIRSIINKSQDALAKYNLVPKSHNLGSLSEFIEKSIISYEFAIYLCSIFTILIICRNKKRHTIIYLFYTLFVLLILYIAIGSIDQKISPRFFTSVFSIATISAWWIYLSHQKYKSNIYIYQYLMAYSLVFILINFLNNQQVKFDKIIKETSYNNQQRMILKESNQKIIIYMGNNEILKYSINPFKIESSFGEKQFFHFRFAQYSNTENYQNILRKYMSSDQIKYANMLEYFCENIDSLVVIAHPNLIELWTDYNKNLYQIDLTHQKIDNGFNAHNDYMYTLSLNTHN